MSKNIITNVFNNVQTRRNSLKFIYTASGIEKLTNNTKRSVNKTLKEGGKIWMFSVDADN